MRVLVLAWILMAYGCVDEPDVVKPTSDAAVDEDASVEDASSQITTQVEVSKQALVALGVYHCTTTIMLNSLMPFGPNYGLADLVYDVTVAPNSSSTTARITASWNGNTA